MIDATTSQASLPARIVQRLRRRLARKIHKYRERQFRRWAEETSRFLQRHAKAHMSFRTDGQIIVEAHNGIRLLYVPEIHRSALDVESKGTWEPVETELLPSLLKMDAVVLDIGAYIGWFTLLAARVSPEIRVHSFEPVPQTYRLLQRNVELNGLNNVTLNNVGVWDENKSLRFTDHRGPKNHVATENNPGHVVAVPCIRIDDYVRENGIKRIDVVKCDADGSEMHILRGARQTLGDLHPMLLLETVRTVAVKYGHSPLDVLTFMKDLGYSYQVIKTRIGVMPASDDPAKDIMIGHNFLFRAI